MQFRQWKLVDLGNFSWEFVTNFVINAKLPLVSITALHRKGDKSLPKLRMTQLSDTYTQH